MPFLNSESMRRIGNIVNGFNNHPMYASYSVNSYSFEPGSGVHAIDVAKSVQQVSRFLFYPGNNGQIGSIEIYGLALQGHFNAIRSSMMCFGMPVSSVDMCFGFVAVHLADY